MDDIVIKRSDDGKCPLCNKEIGEDFKRIEYKGKKIWICQRHKAVKIEADEDFKKMGTG